MAQAPDLSDLLLAAADELRRAKGPAVAKVSPLTELLCESRAEFRDLLQQLETLGVSNAEFARYIDRSKTAVSDWKNYGHSERTPIPDYAPKAAKKLIASLRLRLVASG